MAFDIVVPDLGESIVEATISRWLKQPGDAVRMGEPVVVLETDKVDLEVGAGKEGVLGQIMRGDGEDVKVGDRIGVIDEGAVVSAQAASAPAAARPAEQPARTGAATSTPNLTRAQTVADTAATPVARRAAAAAGLDVAAVPPSSPAGKVKKSDVERYLDQQAARPAPTPETPYPVIESSPYRRDQRVKMSRRRRTIAARLVEAQHTAAMLTTFNEVDMSRVNQIRERRRESFKEKFGVGLGLSSFFVKAAISALKRFPQLNAEIQADEMVMKHYYDIGVAIGAEEGLVVPVLRDADRLSFADIEKAIKTFAAQSKDNTLSLEAMRGGTFTITNGGVFGSLMSTPILNPPQVAILGLHKIEPRPIALDGQVVIRPMMYMALSYDHRIVDGREAVQFLVHIKAMIEDPESLLIEA